MHTLGYRFRPWTKDRAIADGDAILHYIQETARDGGVDKNIRYSHRVVSAAWTERGRALDRRHRHPVGPDHDELLLPLLVLGLLRLRQGLLPPSSPASATSAAPSSTRSSGREDLDYAGKRVVVIGSGATAVTLVPAMTGTRPRT